MHLPLCYYAENITGANNHNNDDCNEMLDIISGGSADNNQKVTAPIFVRSALWEWMITNTNTTNSVYVDLYHYVAKKTSNYDWEDLIQMTQDQQNAGTDPVANVGYTDSLANTIVSYGWTPYQNPMLMKYINIYKKDRYLINPGETNQIEKRIKLNKFWRKDQPGPNRQDVVNKMTKGLSHGIIVIIYGTPRGVTDGKGWITGDCAVNISTNKTIYFQQGVPNRTYNNGDTIFRTRQFTV
jgi:hypothetical protein